MRKIAKLLIEIVSLVVVIVFIITVIVWKNSNDITIVETFNRMWDYIFK